MKKSSLEEIFNFSITLKLVHGIFEFISGVLLFFVSSASFAKLFQFLSKEELAEGRTDKVMNLLVEAARNISVDMKSFLGIYFMVFGIINSWIAIILITKKVRHYTFIEIILGVFILYQAYKFVKDPSVLIFLLIFVDSIILVLIFKYHKFLLKEK